MNIFEFKNSKAGMTLVEMIISLVILSILMTSTMGMIISSSNIFISTSKAAIDRQVGNHVFELLSDVLKYTTHLSIYDNSAKSNAKTNSQYFYLDIQDTVTKSGFIKYKKAGADDETNLYDNSFYGVGTNQRYVQYTVNKSQKSNKHIDVNVKVYREGKMVFNRSATIKCLNLGLDLTSDNPNAIVDKSTAGSKNQFLVFSVDEQIIAGGSDAFSIEYKVGEYMNAYNEILRAYTDDLNAAYTWYTDSYTSTGVGDTINASGGRISDDDFKDRTNQLQKIIFGNSASPKSESYSNKIEDCVNLRLHYQNEIKELLKFTPTASSFKEGSFDTITAEPASGSGSSFTYNTHTGDEYYGVVATKEELYAGYMYTYFDDGNVEIDKDEFPQFTDPDTFFAGTSIETYMNNTSSKSTNQMVILTYFRDNVDDHNPTTNTEYENLVFTEAGGVYATDGNSAPALATTPATSVTSGYGIHTYNNLNYVTKPITNYDEASSSYTDNTKFYIFASEAGKVAGMGLQTYTPVYSFTETDSSASTSVNLNGTTLTVSAGDYESHRHWVRTSLVSGYYEIDDGWLTYTDAFNQVKTATGAKDIKGYGSVSTETHQHYNDKGHDYYNIHITSTTAIPEGWYYYEYTSPYWGDACKAVFYIEKASKLIEVTTSGVVTTTDTDSPKTLNTVVQVGSTIEFTGSHYALGADRTKIPKDRGLKYNQLQYANEESGAIFSIEVPFKSFTAHQYNDYMIYGVDWNSWYVSEPTGLINKLLTNTISFIQNIFGKEANKDIDSIKPENAYQSLGNVGTFTLAETNTTAASFNMAFCVYAPSTGTWYYLPSSSTRLSNTVSKISFTSTKDRPTPIDVELGNGSTWNNSTALMYDVENRKMSSSGLWGLVDTSKDQLWISLPTGGSTELQMVANLSNLSLDGLKEDSFKFNPDTYKYSSITATSATSNISASTDLGDKATITIKHTNPNGNEKEIANGGMISWGKGTNVVTVTVVTTWKDNANNDKTAKVTYTLNVKKS